MSSGPDPPSTVEGAARPSGGPPRFVHLNGPPGIGKSTVAALYAERNPGTLNLDVDLVHQLVGGWQDEENDTWPVVTPLVRAMAASQLRGGRDVVMPQYLAKLSEITAFADLSAANGAEFREVLLLDDRGASIQRFDRRADDVDDPWIRHHRRLVDQRGGPALLGRMYDDLLDVVSGRPGVTIVPSVPGAVEDTVELVTLALRGPVP